jgi:diphthamide biosynthesis enzyme Dph1/Dph2-like protein
LGDTSYSECCIDDVNASHAKANDAIVKFGRACLSTESKSKQKEGKEIIYVLLDSEESADGAEDPLNSVMTSINEEFAG